MSEHLHPGSHPDADSLNAFTEGLLPEHERLQCLAHLAECARCREVVFLAQEPLPGPAAPTQAPAWRRWFAPIPVLIAAVAACVMFLAISLYLHRTPPTPARDVIARIEPPQQPPTPPSITPAETPGPQPPPKRETPRRARQSTSRERSAVTAIAPPMAPIPGPTVAVTGAVSPAFSPPPLAPLPQPSVPLPPTTGAVAVTGVPPISPLSESSVSLSGGALRLSIKHNQGLVDGRTEVAGTVTDPSGAVIPGATVTLRPSAGTPSGTARTDDNGRFKIAALSAGRYDLQVVAPGFMQSSGQIELKAQDVAVVASVLSVGSVSETVEVTAASPVIATRKGADAAALVVNGSVSPGLNGISKRKASLLPSKLPAATTIMNGKVMLAVDSAGALFISQNAGKRWKAIKSVWHGKVLQVVALAEPAAKPPTAVFQLTTDSGADWLSRDGSHWHPAPPQH